MPAESAQRMEHEHEHDDGHNVREAEHGEKKDHGQDEVAAQQHESHKAAAKAAERHGVAHEEEKDHGQDAAGAGGSHHAGKKPEGGHGKNHETHVSAPQPSKPAKKGVMAVIWEKTKSFFKWLKDAVS